ncbi:hypothetical protein CISIN_1g034906mg [Citrus sinensis]|uniref:Uncharacterized protein n=1 Tax=Citrus sinensis TaxID=2711 RepID=A0A067H1D7_CITSI|nr:hypothetical protein CISIN_1g034906mg [Citrus sinensis]
MTAHVMLLIAVPVIPTAHCCLRILSVGFITQPVPVPVPSCLVWRFTVLVLLPHPIIISSSLFLAVASEREQLCKCNQGS